MKLIIKISILLIVFSFNGNHVFSQKINNIKAIELTYGDPLVSNPNRYVKINIHSQSDTSFVCAVETRRVRGRKKRTSSNYAVYPISKVDYLNVVNQFVALQTYDVLSRLIDDIYLLTDPGLVRLGVTSIDGKKLTFNITTMRSNEKTKPFYSLCKEILSLAKLKPGKYLK